MGKLNRTATLLPLSSLIIKGREVYIQAKLIKKGELVGGKLAVSMKNKVIISS